MNEIKFEGDTLWTALAFQRMAVRNEMLEQENAALRQQLEAAKGPREVEQPKEAGDGTG